jgi:putative oxidoreductase
MYGIYQEQQKPAFPCYLCADNSILSTMYNRAIDISLLLLRVTFGGLMIYGHGWKKLLKLINGDPSKFPDPLHIGSEISLVLTVVAEFGCALLVIIGLFTRMATVPLIITMLVAILMVHSGDPFGDIELALIYLVGYLTIFIAGPGWLSVDGRMRNNL